MQFMKTEIPEGYKNTPVGIIPEEWEVRKLGEICTNFKSGQNITSKYITYSDRYPVYGGNGLRGYTNSFTHSGDHILIGRQGALCGNINFVNGENFISEHAIAVKTDLNNDIRFWALKLDYLNLNRLSESSAQPGLSVEKLIKLKVSIPPLPEQHKIAEILSMWDVAIEKQTLLIEKLELRKRALMQQLLTGKKRLKGFDGIVKKQQLKSYLLEISSRNSDNAITNVLSVTNSRGFISQSELFERVVASEDVSKYKIVRQGQFAYNPSRINVGSLDMLKHVDHGILSPMYVVFETNRDHLNPNFLFYHLKSESFTKRIPMYVQGSVRDSLSFDGLTAMKFYIPTLPEQIAIAEILSIADKEIDSARVKLGLIKLQKQGLMQILLNGRTRVKI